MSVLFREQSLLEKVGPHSLVRLSPIVLESFQQHVLQKQLMDLTIELMTLHDLVKKIDPEHMYVFSSEYQAFVKTKVAPSGEEKESSHHTAGAIITPPTD